MPVDLLFVTYARRCAAYGEPVLPEDQVLGCLTAVEGVRVVDGGPVSWPPGAPITPAPMP